MVANEFDLFKGAYFGVPGSGKTRLLYSASLVEGYYPLLVFNLTGNPISIRDYPRDRYTIVNLERAKDTNEIESLLAAAFDFVSASNPNFNSKFAQNFGIKAPIRTIGFDSLSDLNRVAAQELSGISKLKFGAIPRSEVNQIQDYNKLHSYLHYFCRELYSLPYNVVVTCLENYNEKALSYEPALTGKSATQILSYPYFVGRLSVWARIDEQTKKAISKVLQGEDTDDVERILQYSPTLRVQGVKNQYARSEGGFVPNPTFEKLLQVCQLSVTSS